MDMIEIKKGGRYTVLSNSGTDEPMKTEGEYVGYTIFGEEGAVCFRVTQQDGRSFIRLIPVSNLIAIEFSEDQLVSAKSKPEREEGDKTNYIS
ncbi:hypothetical protein [Thermogymnomonas acidicola]|nr:hypothetical protein [Thermogymnomonas acidicola]